jgi:hypothetical protein
MERLRMRLTDKPRRRHLVPIVFTSVLIAAAVVVNGHSATSADATTFDGSSVIAEGPRDFSGGQITVPSDTAADGTWLINAQVPISNLTEWQQDVNCWFTGGKTIARDTGGWHGTESGQSDGGTVTVAPKFEYLSEDYPSYEVLTLSTVRTVGPNSPISGPGQIVLHCYGAGDRRLQVGNVRVTGLKINAMEDVTD